MEKNKNHQLGIILWSLGSVIAFLLTPILMYVIYIIKANHDPHISITVGYWIGFVDAIIPLMATLYGYSLKLANNKDKRYMWVFWIGIITLILTLLLTFACLSIDMPLN